MLKRTGIPLCLALLLGGTALAEQASSNDLLLKTEPASAVAPGSKNYYGGSIAFGRGVGSDRSYIVVGAPKENSGIGAVYIYSGKDGAFVGKLRGREPQSHFGLAVACHDVDHDGYPDILVGAPHETSRLPAGAGASSSPGSNVMRNAGNAYIYSGYDGSLMRQLSSPIPTTQFGQAITAYEVKDASYALVAVGAPLASPRGTLPNSGFVVVYAGASGRVLRQFNGPKARMNAGWSLATADLNADGYVDLIAGAPGVSEFRTTPAGTVLAYSGKDGSPLFPLERSSPRLRSVGSAVAGADVNQDGFADVVVGAPGSSTGGVQSGAVVVFSGADGSVLHLLPGPSTGAYLGSAVAAGDLDGDGRAEIIAGAPGVREDPKNGGPSLGEVRIYTGKEGALRQTLKAPKVVGRHSESIGLFGWSLATCDVKLDKTPDLLVGAPEGGPNPGRAFLFFGRETSTGAAPENRLQ